MNANTITILFCGPIAPKGRPAKGGFEAANRRTIDNLRKRGIKVIEKPYPVITSNAPKLIKISLYCINFPIIFIALIRDIIRYRKSTTIILHLTGLYKSFIYIEGFYLLISKCFHIPLIYDIRAGSMIDYYRKRSFIYRAFFKNILDAVELIFFEGLEFESFLTEITKTDSVYFPNYVDIILDDNSYDRSLMLRKSDEVRMVYFGRLVREKGLMETIEIANLLRKDNINAKLELIGAIDDKLKDEIIKSKYFNGNIVFTNSLSPPELMRKLSYYHYFIFPTKHRGEGHSNALTEAMSYGVVPLCSDNGFNKSVVGDAGFILRKDSSPEEYKKIICQVILSGGWFDLSKKCRDRVKKFYDAEPVIDNVISHYKKLVEI